MSNAPASVIRRLITRRPVNRGHRATEPQALAKAFTHPEGAGVIGPGAEHLLRTVLVDALVDGPERLNVVITLPDLEQLLGNVLSLSSELFASAVHVTETLEEAIEHLESKDPQTSDGAGATLHSPTLWLASPGQDADVVHQTLRNLPTASFITLFQGPWPYGPTHFVDMTGPRRLPTHNVDLLSRNQAVARLHVVRTR